MGLLSWLTGNGDDAIRKPANWSKVQWRTYELYADSWTQKWSAALAYSVSEGDVKDDNDRNALFERWSIDAFVKEPSAHLRGEKLEAYTTKITELARQFSGGNSNNLIKQMALMALDEQIKYKAKRAAGL